MFIFVLFFYQVMTAPVSSKDQERVEMTFDKQAGLVRIIALKHFRLTK